jgi:hypothetical protein
MVKRAFLFLYFVLVVCNLAFSQVSDEITQQLINLYTKYAQSKSGTERLQYVRNPETLKDIFATRYEDRDISYTPLRFGKCSRPSSSPDNLDTYVLEEYVSANRGGKPTEVIQYRYFVKIVNTYKLDWEASNGYNPVTFARFKALKDGQLATMRCYGILTTSKFDNYFAFSIYDELTNNQFRVYINKNHADAMSLLEYLEGSGARPVILEMKFVDDINKYDKEVLINKFIQKGWVK